MADEDTEVSVHLFVEDDLHWPFMAGGLVVIHNRRPALCLWDPGCLLETRDQRVLKGPRP